MTFRHLFPSLITVLGLFLGSLTASGANLTMPSLGNAESPVRAEKQTSASRISGDSTNFTLEIDPNRWHRAAILETLAATRPAVPPSHPRLLLDQAGLTQLKERIATQPWAKASWNKALARANDLARQKIELPPRGANWPHWRVCPVHGSKLETGRQIGPWQWEHLCPVDQHVLLGDEKIASKDYDGAQLWVVHNQWGEDARLLGLAFHVTDQPFYAQKAREILLEYARLYLTYPLHGTHGPSTAVGAGRAQCLSLCESVWLIPLLQGADLVWNTLSEQERRTIADKFILPAIHEVILPHSLGVANIQMWNNSAIGLAGFLLDEPSLIEKAIYDPVMGYRQLMQAGRLADGFWFEGSATYHYYSLRAACYLLEAARLNGLDLYGPDIKSMWDAPLRLAQPDLDMPPFNDSNSISLNDPSRYSLDAQQYTDGIYELGYARFGDPAYLKVLAASQRQDDTALWYGVPTLPSVSPQPHCSLNMDASGYGILARGEGPGATWLCLKYGPHGGGHGHPDKLHLQLYAQGQVLALDPGITWYGTPLRGNWYITTVAHNTLTVDQMNQLPATGSCLAFGSAKGVDYVMADAGRIYPGVQFIRTAALLDQNTLLFIDQIRCEQPRLLDIAYHQRGQWEMRPEGSQAWTPPNLAGYKCFRDTQVKDTGADVLMATRLTQGNLISITLAGGEPTAVITATGFDRSTEDRVPLVLFRRQAKETAYAWTVGLDGAPLKLTWLPVQVQGQDSSRAVGAAVSVEAKDGRAWELAVNPQKRLLHVAIEGERTLVVQEPFAVIGKRQQ